MKSSAGDAVDDRGEHVLDGVRAAAGSRRRRSRAPPSAARPGRRRSSRRTRRSSSTAGHTHQAPWCGARRRPRAGRRPSAEIRGWKTTSTRPSRMSAGTIAVKAPAGSTSSSSAPVRPPISEATPEPQDPRCAGRPARGGSRWRRRRSPAPARRCWNVGGHRGDAERQQGRERDQRSRPHHGVDGAGGEAREEDRRCFEEGH